MEAPAGKLERGEDPFEACKREQREETGTTAEQYLNLGAALPHARLLRRDPAPLCLPDHGVRGIAAGRGRIPGGRAHPAAKGGGDGDGQHHQRREDPGAGFKGRPPGGAEKAITIRKIVLKITSCK